jgi:hypothetical protein
MGGYDFASGDLENLPLARVELTAGEATNLVQDLVAMRRLSVTFSVDPSITPLGDAQGTGMALVYRVNNPSWDVTPSFGRGYAGCIDASASGRVEAYAVGSGAFYVLGLVDDLGLPDPDNDGVLLSVETLDPLVLREANKVEFAPDQYGVDLAVVLNQMLEEAGPPGADQIHCP